MPTPDQDLTRILRGVTISERGCWIWRPASRNPLGYGQVWYSGRLRNAHIAVWECFFGPCPEDRELDHLCRVSSCVNPLHLEPITHRENMQRGMWGQKTHCPRGHEYTEANTYYSPEKRHRWCRQCARDHQKRLRVAGYYARG